MIRIINFLNAEVRKRILVLQVLEVYYLRHENLCFGRESVRLEGGMRVERYVYINYQQVVLA